MLNLLVIIILSYLVGSIPTSILVTRKVKGIDIRSHGSGNAGGTNVMRVLGWKYGVFVMLLDACKGVIAVVLIARLYLGSFPFPNETFLDDFTLVQMIAGVSAVIGHIWTVFANFRGGKGIATGVGTLATLATVDIILAFVIFLIVVYLSKYISLGSIIGSLSIPLIMIIRANVFHVDIPGYYTLLPFLAGICILIIYTHRKNIRRLLNGSESKVAFGKKGSGGN